MGAGLGPSVGRSPVRSPFEAQRPDPGSAQPACLSALVSDTICLLWALPARVFRQILGRATLWSSPLTEPIELTIHHRSEQHATGEAARWGFSFHWEASHTHEGWVVDLSTRLAHGREPDAVEVVTGGGWSAFAKQVDRALQDMSVCPDVNAEGGSW